MRLRPLLLLAALCASCSPMSSPNSRLLVDTDSPRYGRIIRHGNRSTIRIHRGDGVAELFVSSRVGNYSGWLQVDTGAPFCVLNTAIADREGFIPTASGDILTAAGSVESSIGTVPSLRIGSIEVQKATVLSLDDEYANDFTVNGVRGHVIGILGADLLDYLDASIDLRSNLIHIRHP